MQSSAFVGGTLRQRLSESLGAFGDVFRSPDLRRLELSWASAIMGHWAYGVALAVFAYQAGGAAAVGLLGLIKMIPATLASPFTGVLADRYRRQSVMVVTDLLRAAIVALAALAAFADAPAAVVFVVSGLYSLVATAFRPAQAALLPSLARSPGELTAANVASSSIENVGTFLGPALAGFVLAVSGTGVAFAVTALAFVSSALLVRGIRHDEPGERATRERRSLRRETTAGFAALGSDRDVRLLVALYGAQTLVGGALNVLIVAFAIDLLDLGDAGVGFLYSAIGIGGLVGALAAAALVGRKRLAGDFRLGMLVYGIPLALLAALDHPVLALVLLGAVGVGSTVIDVAALTLMQRAIPEDVLARVFGVLESILLGTLGLGAILAPVLIELAGLRTALVVAGVFLPLLGLLSWRRLSAIDRAAQVPERELQLVRSVPIFAPLPAATAERLATSLVPMHVRAGEPVFRQGDPGDRFYVLADGEAEVTVDGNPGTTLRPPDHFGEIALLRDVPRTATVTATTDLELYALERDDFIAAVTGHRESAEAAEAVVGARLGTVRTSVA